MSFKTPHSYLSLRDSNLIGEIGEMIAGKYLRCGGIWCHKIGKWDHLPIAYSFTSGELKVYLVEVKATGPGPGRHDLNPRIKGRVLKDIETAKALGFTVLLVLVRLLDNWGWKVTCREL